MLLELLGLAASASDPGMFIRSSCGVVSLILVCMIELLVAASDTRVVQEPKDVLSCICDLRDTGEATYVARRFRRISVRIGMLLSQKHFGSDLVNKFDLSDAKTKHVPLSTSVRLLYDGGKAAINLTVSL